MCITKFFSKNFTLPRFRILFRASSCRKCLEDASLSQIHGLREFGMLNPRATLELRPMVLLFLWLDRTGDSKKLQPKRLAEKEKKCRSRSLPDATGNAIQLRKMTSSGEPATRLRAARDLR
ncbi:hypothetical protein M9H77_16441 [Catharanthus roseus]|uniref:Uncharacterized protein n=1 Tax=Catharanthus roseus TaxID=4058 RepID=A0ACC0B1R7_CATRO|nr:hypothetical protein M9H77_16441 [Catharanthus roseus]